MGGPRRYRQAGKPHEIENPENRGLEPEGQASRKPAPGSLVRSTIYSITLSPRIEAIIFPDG